MQFYVARLDGKYTYKCTFLAILQGYSQDITEIQVRDIHHLKITYASIMLQSSWAGQSPWWGCPVLDPDVTYLQNSLLFSTGMEHL